MTNNQSDLLIQIDQTISKQFTSSYHESFNITEYYNEIYNETTNFVIPEGNLFIFNQCSSESGVIIDFMGNGSLQIVNSDFYYTQLRGNLEVEIADSTLAYTEIFDKCIIILRNTILQQYFAFGNTTSKLFYCYPSKLFDGSPIPSSISSGTMIKAGGYSRIILIEAISSRPCEVNTALCGRKIIPWSSLWGVGPAGLIWLIEIPLENEDGIEALLAGKVCMEFYVEGFNPHPTIKSENISAQLYVDDILEQKMDVISDNTNWNWHIQYKLDTSKYTLDNHTLGLVVNDSESENSMSVITQFIEEHTLSKPIMVYPTGGERLAGIVTIEWNTSRDSYNHSITYSLYYSQYEFGQLWRTLATGISSTTYEWDTRVLPDRNTYRLKAIATCAEGLTAESTETSFFSINNTQTDKITTTSPSTTLSYSSTQSETTITYPAIVPFLDITGVIGILFSMTTVVIIIRRHQIG
ncbi:MAG: hypothetical protein ACFFDC_11090 [Promethearchaeota archaeon]